MRGQFRVQPGAQSPKTMRMIQLDPQLFRQLPMHGLNNLPLGIQQSGHVGRQLLRLVPSWNGQQVQPIRVSQCGGDRCTDIPFIADNHQVRVLTQQQ